MLRLKPHAIFAIGEMALGGLNAVQLRGFNHTGAGQSDTFVIPAFARQIALIEVGKQDPLPPVGALDRWRDYLHLPDVCGAYAAVLNANLGPRAIYNIASRTPRRIVDILDALIAQNLIRVFSDWGRRGQAPFSSHRLIRRLWSIASVAARQLTVTRRARSRSTLAGGLALDQAQPFPVAFQHKPPAICFVPCFLMSNPWVTRFSSRSAHDRRRMGLGGRSVSI
jgi:hypothetical protein